MKEKETNDKEKEKVVIARVCTFTFKVASERHLRTNN